METCESPELYESIQDYLHERNIFRKFNPDKMVDDFRESKIKLYGISPSDIEIAGYVKGIKDTIESLKNLGYIDINEI